MILKTAKRLNNFTSSDIALILEEKEENISANLTRLCNQGYIKKISENNFLFVKTFESKKLQSIKKQQKKPSLEKEEVVNNLYYYFRDYYLLYSAPDTQTAYKYAVADLITLYKSEINIQLSSEIELTQRLKSEFREEIRALYRKKSYEHKEIFHRRLNYQPAIYRSKRTINTLPEKIDFCINEKINAFRTLCAKYYEDFIQTGQARVEINTNEYEFTIKNPVKEARFADLTFDTLITLIYLYKRKSDEDSLDKKGYAFFSIDDVVLINSNLSKCQKEIRIGRKKYYNAYIKMLGEIYFSKNSSEKSPLIDIHPVKIPSGESEFYYSLKADPTLIQRGEISIEMLKLHTYHDRREKFIGYHLNYLKSVCNKNTLVMTVEEFVHEIGFDITPVVKPILRQRLEKALTKLTDKGIIKSWRYLDFDKEVLWAREKFPYFISRTLEVLF